MAAAVWALLIIVAGVAPTQGVVSATTPSHETASTTLAHFVEYLVLAALIAAACGGRCGRLRGVVVALTLAVGLGAAIEAVQAFLPYRDCQVIDVLVNTAGAACGVAVFSAVAAARGRGASWRA